MALEATEGEQKLGYTESRRAKENDMEKAEISPNGTGSFANNGNRDARGSSPKEETHEEKSCDLPFNRS